ncbi:hypothetical protein HPB47_021340 [Ixodes persulcatus]|uniref:Uncharacterized protein n=1 Tax=Ixodes persulcatus TaxID=34615 RepID=A0AC60QDU7_IXOPE|nr:hypothetical protein HPB47_021340 [Ixodes persulcatus]
MYWCAAVSRGNHDLLVDAWTSMTRHVVNFHTDHPGIYTRCFHGPVTDGEWLVSRTCMAALHFNENDYREQAISRIGQRQWKRKPPKVKKGTQLFHAQ